MRCLTRRITSWCLIDAIAITEIAVGKVVAKYIFRSVFFTPQRAPAVRACVMKMVSCGCKAAFVFGTSAELSLFVPAHSKSEDVFVLKGIVVCIKRCCVTMTGKIGLQSSGGSDGQS